MWKRLPRITAGLVMILMLAGCSLRQGKHFAMQVGGAVQRDISGEQIYYEGRQIYIESKGTGGDIIVILVNLPQDPTRATYGMAPNGPASGEYFEAIGGVSRQFYSDVRGTLTLTEVGRQVSGTVDFRVSGRNNGQPETVSVTGTFSNVPTGPTSSDTLAAALLVGVLGSLVILNFVMQFHVGRVVYAAEKGWAWRSLRGTRTFIRGWRHPQLRMVMLAWSLVIGGMLLFVLVLGVAASAR